MTMVSGVVAIEKFTFRLRLVLFVVGWVLTFHHFDVCEAFFTTTGPRPLPRPRFNRALVGLTSQDQQPQTVSYGRGHGRGCTHLFTKVKLNGGVGMDTIEDVEDTFPMKESSSSSGSLWTDLSTKFRIARMSLAAGAGWKQMVADVLAGDDYDALAVQERIVEVTASHPCVLFTWGASPSCQAALAKLDLVKDLSKLHVVRLDQPWKEGNQLRAELGRLTGKTSVPSVWIGGTYVGGYDAGTGPDSPGLVDLAFTGELRNRLLAAGALTPTE